MSVYRAFSLSRPMCRVSPVCARACSFRVVVGHDDPRGRHVRNRGGGCRRCRCSRFHLTSDNTRTMLWHFSRAVRRDRTFGTNACSTPVRRARANSVRRWCARWVVSFGSQGVLGRRNNVKPAGTETGVGWCGVDHRYAHFFFIFHRGGTVAHYNILVGCCPARGDVTRWISTKARPSDPPKTHDPYLTWSSESSPPLVVPLYPFLLYDHDINI